MQKIQSVYVSPVQDIEPYAVTLFDLITYPHADGSKQRKGEHYNVDGPDMINFMEARNFSCQTSAAILHGRQQVLPYDVHDQVPQDKTALKVFPL